MERKQLGDGNPQFESACDHFSHFNSQMILRILASLLLSSLVASEATQDTVPSFDQFVYTYGKQYKEDEYAY